MIETAAGDKDRNFPGGPMKPHSPHSEDALVAYPDNIPARGAFDSWSDANNNNLRTAFDRGRESKQHTDRETIAAIIEARIWHTGFNVFDLADAILAAPSLSLVAVRDDLVAWFHENTTQCVHFMEPTQCERWADALFASGILEPSSDFVPESELTSMLAERDEWYERLDKLIYSLATVEQIGEWSNANDPVAEFEQLIHAERKDRSEVEAAALEKGVRAAVEQFRAFLAPPPDETEIQAIISAASSGKDEA